MTETLRVYWDNYDLLVPNDRDSDPSPQMKELIDANVPLYVHPGGPVLVGHVPGKTSVRGDGNRIEDLYFQYQGTSSGRLLEKFGTLIDLLHQSQDRIDPPQSLGDGGVSEAVIDTGIFDEYWHFQNPDMELFDEHRTPFPLLLSDIEATLPPLKSVHRRALLTLLEDSDETRWLGIEDITTAVEVIAYLLDEEMETAMAVHEHTDTPLDPADVVFVPGNRNFEPLDNSTKSALKQSFDNVTQNLKKWFTRLVLDSIETLVEDETVSPVATLRDLETIREYVDQDVGGSIRSDIGKALLREYNEITESTHLSEEEKDEIRATLLTTLEDAHTAVADQLVEAKSAELVAKIREIEQGDMSPQEEYAYYRELYEILDEETRAAIGVDSSSVPPQVRQFAETYRSVVAQGGPGEAVATRIQERVQRELDSYLADTRQHVIRAVTDEFERLINNVALPNDELSSEDRLRALKLAGAGLKDPSAIETLAGEYGESEHVERLTGRLQELADREALDTKSAKEIERRIEGLLDQQIHSLAADIQQEYQERLDAIVQQIAQDTIPPREKAQQLNSLAQLLKGKTPAEIGTRPAPIQNAHATLERLDDHASLSDTRKEKCRTAVLGDIETFGEQVDKQVQTPDSDDYLKEVREQLDIMAKEQGHAPKYILDTLDDIERIIEDKRYLDASVLHHDKKYVRKVSSILHDEFDDRVMRDGEKADVLNELQTKREIYSTDEEHEYSLTERVLGAVPSVVLWALGVVVILVVLLMAIFFVLWWTGELSDPAEAAAVAVRGYRNT